jgi:hypothetical protein
VGGTGQLLGGSLSTSCSCEGGGEGLGTFPKPFLVVVVVVGALEEQCDVQVPRACGVISGASDG